MKLKTIGAGHAFCRWPLIPPCWVIQTHDSNILVGCPPQAGARLEAVGLTLDKIDMIVPLGYNVAQAGGLDEFGAYFKDKPDKPYISCPENLLGKIMGRLEHPHGFEARAVKKIFFKEEHVTETFTFLDNFSGSYGFRLETAQIFCSGDAKVNEDWLFQNMDCEALLHASKPELEELPIYLQNKIWIYGYETMPEGNDPIPMLFLPQGSVVYDSDRRDKTMLKERYIREHSKRIIGNDRREA